VVSSVCARRTAPLTFEVEDEGNGFDTATVRADQYEHRLDALGGRVVVTSRPGAGTCVRAALPLEPVHRTDCPPLTAGRRSQRTTENDELARSSSHTGYRVDSMLRR
jgi:hypothetical protein